MPKKYGQIPQFEYKSRSRITMKSPETNVGSGDFWFDDFSGKTKVWKLFGRKNREIVLYSNQETARDAGQS